MKYLILASAFLFGALSAQASIVQCTGNDMTTDAFVTGQCTDGSFNGYDEMTGAMVWGTCTEGGPLNATDSVTGDIVMGNCSQAM